MTCAEARRQPPGPEGASPAAVQEHLAACDPCRAEADALREVDRRLGRLGAYRLLSTAEQVLLLDRQMSQLRGRPAPRPRRPALWLGIFLLLLGGLLFVLLRR